MKYFGTNLTEHGHYIWNVGSEYLLNPSIDFKPLSFDPEDMPKSKVKGDVEFYHIGGYTILAICGSCIDNKPGTRSVFWVAGDLTKENMIVLIKLFPVLVRILNAMELKFKINW